jgi:hypothetical protein
MKIKFTGEERPRAEKENGLDPTEHPCVVAKKAVDVFIFVADKDNLGIDRVKLPPKEDRANLAVAVENDNLCILRELGRG